LRQLSTRQIVNDFSSRFRDVIKSGELSILVHDNGKQIAIAPEEYLGTQILKEKVITTYGPVYFEIHLNPGRNGVVHLRQGIQTLVENFGVAKERELGDEVWRSGYLNGQIRADWLSPTASRQDFELDLKAEAFFDVVRGYNEQLAHEVDQYLKQTDKKVVQSYVNKIHSALRKYVRDFPELGDLINGYEPSRRGVEVPGKPIPGLKIGEVEEPEEPEHHHVPHVKHPKRIIDPNEPGTTRARPVRAIHMQVEDLTDPHVLSSYHVKAGILFINSIAPSFIEAIRQPELRANYFAGLIGKELLSQRHADPKRLADEILKFQVQFAAYLK
jgi:hypothetical protein